MSDKVTVTFLSGDNAGHIRQVDVTESNTGQAVVDVAACEDWPGEVKPGDEFVIWWGDGASRVFWSGYEPGHPATRPEYRQGEVVG